MYRDARGLAITLEEPAALDPYERAIRAFQNYRGDPIASLDEALALDPAFAAAAAAKALILIAFFERGTSQAATVDDETVKGNKAREGLADANAKLSRGEWLAGVVAEEESSRPPLERAGPPGGTCSISTASWPRPPQPPRVYRTDAGAGQLCRLGIHAYGLEECNQPPEAEATGRRPRPRRRLLGRPCGVPRDRSEPDGEHVARGASRGLGHAGQRLRVPQRVAAGALPPRPRRPRRGARHPRRHARRRHGTRAHARRRHGAAGGGCAEER